MDSEASLIRIQSPVSELVDSAIRIFIVDHSKEQLQGHLRWHGADLWMIFARSEVSPLVRRVTIAAYSDFPDELLFVPDVVAEKSEGRYVLPPEVRGRAVKRLSIFNLLRGLLVDGRAERSGIAAVTDTLEDAWSESAVLSRKESEHLVLLP